MIKTDKMMQEIAQKQGEILGIVVSSTNTKRVLSFVRGKLSKFDKKQENYRPFFITTPNPEMVIRAQKDKKFRKTLNSSDLSIPDGIGLAQADTFNGLKSPDNMIFRFPTLLFQGGWIGLMTLLNKDILQKNIRVIKGRDLFLSLIKLSNKKRWRVFFLGGENDEGRKASQLLTNSYKSVSIESYGGPITNKGGVAINMSEKKMEKEAIERINKFKPHLLFVAFGAPKQEKWVHRNRNKLNVGGIMVVGGAFNYISGKSILPPKWMEKVGLEWMWRLLTEPKRIKRIFLAFPTLPILVFKKKLFQNGG